MTAPPSGGSAVDQSVDGPGCNAIRSGDRVVTRPPPAPPTLVPLEPEGLKWHRWTADQTPARQLTTAPMCRRSAAFRLTLMMTRGAVSTGIPQESYCRPSHVNDKEGFERTQSGSHAFIGAFSVIGTITSLPGPSAAASVCEKPIPQFCLSSTSRLVDSCR